MKPKIIIYVQGGSIQNVNVNQDADIIIVDWDNIKADSKIENISIYEPDNIFKDGEGYTLFEPTSPRSSVKEIEQDIQDRLKELAF
jgi:hypothetical protein